MSRVSGGRDCGAFPEGQAPVVGILVSGVREQVRVYGTEGPRRERKQTISIVESTLLYRARSRVEEPFPSSSHVTVSRFFQVIAFSRIYVLIDQSQRFVAFSLELAGRNLLLLG